MDKKWQIDAPIGQEVVDRFPELNKIILQLLANRGLTNQSQIDDFLNPNYDDQIIDPFLFSDMEKAVARIFTAVKNHDRVMVFGDYDADGVCATVIISEALSGLGLDVETYIPFRETEGYGLNKNIVQRVIDQKFDLAITVDCGISNFAEIKMLKDGGVDVIISDHHQGTGDKPPALAIINPSLADSGYPFSGLCGAGVAFKIVQALMLYQEKNNLPIKLPVGFDKWLLDLVAIATVGDIMPLLEENRVLVRYGLTVLAQTRRLGLAKLIEAINNVKSIDSQYLGWRLVPRLNAAGRIDHASVAFNLLTEKDESEAERLVAELEKNNRNRQQITDKIINEAEAQLHEFSTETKIIWAVGEHWLAGVVGLVAGRLSDRYNRPAIIVTKEGEEYVGSGRSIPSFDITKALKECSAFLARFGGHSQACGFKVIGEDNFNKFKQKMTQLAKDAFAQADLRPILKIDAEISLADISWKLIDGLDDFEPFGEANPRPLFVARNLKIRQVSAVGADNKHLRLIVGEVGEMDNYKLIGFGFGDWLDKLKTDDSIDVVFELGVNEWNGNKEFQLKIIDLKKIEK